jgi:hypothetical protein
MKEFVSLALRDLSFDPNYAGGSDDDVADEDMGDGDDDEYGEEAASEFSDDDDDDGEDVSWKARARYRCLATWHGHDTSCFRGRCMPASGPQCRSVLSRIQFSISNWLFVGAPAAAAAACRCAERRRRSSSQRCARAPSACPRSTPPAAPRSCGASPSASRTSSSTSSPRCAPPAGLIA